MCFVFLDTIKVKSRVFGILVGIIFVSTNVYNMYTLVFRNNEQDVVLLKYTIQENEYTFMKRSTKLTIYIQIMLFSMDGIYTLFIDRRQELMIFATGHIYREAGTTQKIEIDNSLKWRINWSQRGGDVCFGYTDMLGCRTTLLLFYSLLLRCYSLVHCITKTSRL